MGLAPLGLDSFCIVQNIRNATSLERFSPAVRLRLLCIFRRFRMLVGSLPNEVMIY